MQLHCCVIERSLPLIIMRHRTFVTTNHYATVLEFTDLEAVHGSGSATLVILESSSSGFNI